ncbi:MAG TPA: biotin/lipoyl-containing protein [Vitreimonas sp.]|nr:biotin/lipoyl-containing protein [Vitreimonas sp.]
MTDDEASGSPPPDKAMLDPLPDEPEVTDDGDASLLRLIDRLAVVLDRSDLSELEVEAGGTALVLRKAAAPTLAAAGAVAEPAGVRGPSDEEVGVDSASPSGPAARPSVKAPLTGIFYGAPAPGSPAYVQVGGEVAVGQVIGLIEAMKLFNEIKSDLAGRVARVVVDSGQLVKAKQPLIEVDPL